MLGQLAGGGFDRGVARRGVGRHAGDDKRARGERAVAVLLDEKAKSHLHTEEV
jgi:hypothetical protein